MASPFDARCERREDCVVVWATGELDIDSAVRLRAVLRSPEAHAPAVILDLSRVSFIDSSGLSAIVAEHQRAIAEQFQFAVATGGATQVERLFELSGLRETLTIIEDPDAMRIA